MIKRIVFAAAFLFIIQSTSIARVQAASSTHSPGKTDEALTAILTASRRHIEKGEACLATGDVECARREFDGAVDEYLEARIDLRSEERLLAGRRGARRERKHPPTPSRASRGANTW